jgi:4a-hydroxytetrahydrobiopterin dehydratase
MTTELAKRHCEPCEKGTAPLKGKAIERLKQNLGEGWKVVDEHHLEREYSFKDFREALEFTNRVGEIAEAEGHHPDLFLTWGKVGIKLWTHSLGGLSENDFILAAKADAAQRPAPAAG